MEAAEQHYEQQHCIIKQSSNCYNILCYLNKKKFFLCL